MITTVQVKNLDLPFDTVERLKEKAAAHGCSLKHYMERLLISSAKTDSAGISPTGDSWYDDPDNLALVDRGISEEKRGRAVSMTVEEMKARFGL